MASSCATIWVNGRSTMTGSRGGILVEERHRLEFLAGLGREILQEGEHQLAEILVRRRRAEEIFQPALRQRRLGGISIDEGHACALGGLACRGSDRGEVGADEGLDLLLADETRSEEHTSELQSLRHLVCRLLLE